jgi:hypothetical protein
MALQRFFSFLILYTVGGTPWTGDQPVARPLLTRRINAHRHPCPKLDSNPRPQCLSGPRRFMPWTARPLWSASKFCWDYVLMLLIVSSFSPRHTYVLHKMNFEPVHACSRNLFYAFWSWNPLHFRILLIYFVTFTQSSFELMSCKQY